MPPAFESRLLAGVPALLAPPAHAQPPWPVAFWFHGFGVDKEVHRAELARLAGEGFLAVGVDAVGHGERADEPLLRQIREAPRREALPQMIELAAQTAREVSALIDALVRDRDADPARIALAGVSMGAYVVYRAVVLEPRIRAAVSLLGSPEWPHPLSPHREIDALARVALLSIVAERDENVPPTPARRLHEELERRHPHATQRFVELPDAEHLMGEADWSSAMDELLGWLRRHGAAL